MKNTHELPLAVQRKLVENNISQINLYLRDHPQHGFYKALLSEVQRDLNHLIARQKKGAAA